MEESVGLYKNLLSILGTITNNKIEDNIAEINYNIGDINTKGEYKRVLDKLHTSWLFYSCCQYFQRKYLDSLALFFNIK